MLLLWYVSVCCTIFLFTLVSSDAYGACVVLYGKGLVHNAGTFYPIFGWSHHFSSFRSQCIAALHCVNVWVKTHRLLHRRYRVEMRALSEIFCKPTTTSCSWAFEYFVPIVMCFGFKQFYSDFSLFFFIVFFLCRLQTMDMRWSWFCAPDTNDFFSSFSFSAKIGWKSSLKVHSCMQTDANARKIKKKKKKLGDAV